MRFLWALLLAAPVLADTVPTVAIAPASLSFVYQSGFFPPYQQALVITGPQGSTFTVTYPANQSWLLLSNGTSSASGTLPAVIQVEVFPVGLGLGNYTSSIALHTPQGDYAIPVNLLVSQSAVMVSNPGFAFESGGGFPIQVIAVGLSTGQAVPLVATPSVPWITAVPSGSTVVLRFDSSKAAAGLNSGSVEVRPLLPLTKALTLPVLYLAGGPNSPGPLALSPAALSFSGSDSQTVIVTGPAFTAASNSPWLSASADSQSLTVSVDASGLAAGSYQGTIALTASGVVELLPVSLTVGAAAPPNLAQVTSAASYAAGTVSPGEIVALFGTNLGPNPLTGLQLDANGFVSSNLAGVQVLFNGKAAPLIYAGAKQVSAVAPYELDGQTSAAVQVVVNGQASNTLNVPVAAAVPGVFTADASGTGQGAILNADLTVNGASNPAAAGSTVAVYMTGEGQTDPSGTDGQVTGGVSPVPKQAVTATIGGQPAQVTFAGEAPGLVSGVMQVNVAIPAGASPGNLPLVISVGGVPSQNGVTVSVR